MKRTVRAALGLGLLLVLSGCGHGPALTTHANHVVEGAPRIHLGDTVTIGSMFACLDEPGSVTITDIAPIGATGMEVTGWALRPNPFWQPPPSVRPGEDPLMVGVERKALATFDFPSGREVDSACGKSGEGVELAVEVRKTVSGPAGAAGWVVTYLSGGTSRSLEFPQAIRLCSEDKAWAKSCEALPV